MTPPLPPVAPLRAAKGAATLGRSLRSLCWGLRPHAPAYSAMYPAAETCHDPHHGPALHHPYSDFEGQSCRIISQFRAVASSQRRRLRFPAPFLFCIDPAAVLGKTAQGSSRPLSGPWPAYDTGRCFSAICNRPALFPGRIYTTPILAHGHYFQNNLQRTKGAIFYARHSMQTFRPAHRSAR